MQKPSLLLHACAPPCSARRVPPSGICTRHSPGPQRAILAAQVKQVYGVGQNCEGFGRHLNGLFKQAITAGKRVRAETKIASGAVSVSSAAAELAALKLPTQQLQDAKVRHTG